MQNQLILIVYRRKKKENKTEIVFKIKIILKIFQQIKNYYQ